MAFALENCRVLALSISSLWANLITLPFILPTTFELCHIPKHIHLLTSILNPNGILDLLVSRGRHRGKSGAQNKTECTCFYRGISKPKLWLLKMLIHLSNNLWGVNYDLWDHIMSSLFIKFNTFRPLWLMKMEDSLSLKGAPCLNEEKLLHLSLWMHYLWCMREHNLK